MGTLAILTPFFATLIPCGKPNQNSKVFPVSCGTKSASLFELWKVPNTYVHSLHPLGHIHTYKETYIRREPIPWALYTRRDIHMERHTHEGTCTRRRHAHERDICTEEHTHEKTYRERHTHEGTYTRRDIHMRGHAHEGACTSRGHRRTYTWRKHGHGGALAEGYTQEGDIHMKRHTHGMTYTWSDIHTQQHREHAHEGNIA